MLQAYTRLLNRHPVLTKSASAFLLGIGGDALAQRIEYSSTISDGGATSDTNSSSANSAAAPACSAPQSPANPGPIAAAAAPSPPPPPGLFSAFPNRVGGWYDAERGAAFAALATFWNGPFMHHYFNMMSARFPASLGLRGLLSKTALTQALLNPFVYLPLFFSWTALARGLTWQQAETKVRAEYSGTSTAVYHCLFTVYTVCLE